MVKDYFQSFSNTSTTSVESGIFELDFEEHYENIGETVEKILVDARSEDRVICGWKNAVQHFNETENLEHSIFFFYVPSTQGDCISHMQEVMTTAFCYDYGINVIELDSIEKMNSILGEKSSHSCAIVQRSSTSNFKNADDEIDIDELTSLEKELVEYCEDILLERTRPIVRLPEK